MTARLNRRLKTLDRDDIYFNSSSPGYSSTQVPWLSDEQGIF